MTETPDDPVSATRRWLWTARIGAIASPVFLLSSYLIRDPRDFSVLEWLALVAVASTPYFLVLHRLSGQNKKRGFALAAVWSSLIFVQSVVISLALLFTAKAHGHWFTAVGYSVFSLVQAVLIAAAVRCYYALGKHRDDKKDWARAIAIAGFFFVLLLAVGSIVLSS